jgi:hypothetical protein
LVGVLGAWAGVKASLAGAESERERAFIWKSSWAALIFATLFCGALLGAVFFSIKFWRTYPILITAALLALSLGYVVALFTMIIRGNRRLRQIHAEELAAGRAWVAPIRRMFMPVEYRSRWTLLGWPLVHIRMGTSPDGKLAVARGWIAMGDVAFGLIACGGASVGVISVGGVSIGLMAIGGAAVGLLTLAGIGIGGWAFGCCAIGYLAYGGSAIAWHGAYGGAAMAHDFALGGAAFALHANDEIAKAVLQATPFFQHAQAIMAWASLLFCMPIGMVLWRALRLCKTIKSRMPQDQTPPTP